MGLGSPPMLLETPCTYVQWGPCLVPAQLSHVAIPSSRKDSLIPTEFPADKGEHQKCCLFFFSATPNWLASLEGQPTYLETKEGQVSREAGTGCGLWDESTERPSQGQFPHFTRGH